MFKYTVYVTKRGEGDSNNAYVVINPDFIITNV